MCHEIWNTAKLYWLLDSLMFEPDRNFYPKFNRITNIQYCMVSWTIVVFFFIDNSIRIHIQHALITGFNPAKWILAMFEKYIQSWIFKSFCKSAATANATNKIAIFK